jgi:hypothetical protein
MPEFRLKNEYVVQVLPGLALERLKHIHRIGRYNITSTNFVLTNCLFTKNKHQFCNDRKKKIFVQILQQIVQKVLSIFVITCYNYQIVIQNSW